jgi:hypothetical protein
MNDFVMYRPFSKELTQTVLIVVKKLGGNGGYGRYCLQNSFCLNYIKKVADKGISERKRKTQVLISSIVC